MHYVAAVIILILLSAPVLAVGLVVLVLFLLLAALVCFALAHALDAAIPEEQKRWSERGPDEEEIRTIEQELRSGNISLT